MSQGVSIAECLIAQTPSTLKAYCLGLCQTVSLYDPQQRIGATRHMLLAKLPDKLPANVQGKFDLASGALFVYCARDTDQKTL